MARTRSRQLHVATRRLSRCLAIVDYLQPLRHAALHGERLHQPLHRCLLRDDVGIHHHRSHHTRRRGVLSARTAVLAITHTVDRRTGYRVLHHRPAAIARRRTDQGVCRRSHRPYQDQVASTSLHIGKVDLEHLSRAHHRLHPVVLCGGNGTFRQLQLCHDDYGYGRLLHPQHQYRVLPFAIARIHLYVLLFPIGCQLHTALCRRHQV